MRPAWLRGPVRVDQAFWVGLFAAAAATRLAIWQSPIYGDEGHMFLTARTFGGRIPNVHYLLGSDTYSLAPLFWYRPLTHVPLFAGASVSFDAWRLNHLLITSLTPVIAFGLLRTLGVGRSLAVGAASIFVVSPIFVAYGVLVFHDALGTVAFGLALWARVAGRHLAGACGFLAAAWVEELSMFGLAYLLVFDVLRGMRAGTSSLWPLRLTTAQTGYAFALALSPFMLLLSLAIGGRFPGHGNPSGFLLMVDRLFLLAWFAPLIFFGLRSARTREVAGLGLVYPAFYVAYYLTGHSVQIWWMLLPGFLSVVAATFALQDWFDRARGGSPRRSWAPKAVAVLLTALLVVHLGLPSSAAWKARPTMPFSGHAEWNLMETYEFQRGRDPYLPQVIDKLNESQRGTVFLVDVGWFFVFAPFSLLADTVRHAYTGWPSDDVHEWGETVDVSDVVIVFKSETQLNRIFLETYSDCAVYENEEYVVIDAPTCRGRSDALDAAFAADRAQDTA